MTNEEKLLELWEDKQVARVMLRFGRALDTGDWAAYRSCFTDQVNIDFKRLTGQDEVRVSADLWTRFAEQILSPVRRHHTYTNWDIRVDGDRAYALVYMTARHWKATDLGGSENTQYGWYDVWFERAGDGWLINRVKHDFQWVAGNDALLVTQDPELGATMQEVFTAENKKAAQAVLASS
jgi:SnoaL-like domain